MTYNIITSDISCSSTSDGILINNFSGGLSPYTIKIYNNLGFYYQETNLEDFSVIDNLNDLEAADYTIVLSDANDCSIIDQITINSAQEIAVTETTFDLNCFNSSDGSVEFIVEGNFSLTYFRLITKVLKLMKVLL